MYNINCKLIFKNYSRFTKKANQYKNVYKQKTYNYVQLWHNTKYIQLKFYLKVKNQECIMCMYIYAYTLY